RRWINRQNSNRTTFTESARAVSSTKRGYGKRRSILRAIFAFSTRIIPPVISQRSFGKKELVSSNMRKAMSRRGRVFALSAALRKSGELAMQNAFDSKLTMEVRRNSQSDWLCESYSRSHDAKIRVYDAVGNVIETHGHAGDLVEP